MEEIGGNPAIVFGDAKSLAFTKKVIFGCYDLSPASNILESLGSFAVRSDQGQITESDLDDHSSHEKLSEKLVIDAVDHALIQSGHQQFCRGTEGLRFAIERYHQPSDVSRFVQRRTDPEPLSLPRRYFGCDRSFEMRSVLDRELGIANDLG